MNTRLPAPNLALTHDGTLAGRIGDAIRSARTDAGWSQRRLGAEACVPQSVIADVENGRGASLESIERLFDALELRVDFRGPVTIGAGTSDVVHRSGIAVIRHLVDRALRLTATEQHVADGNLRGWIDLMGYEPVERCLSVVEYKTEISDLGATKRQVDLYARGCLGAADRLGWKPAKVQVILVLLGTREADRFVAENRRELADAFPMRGRAAVGALLDGTPASGRGLLALDPRAHGRQALTSFRVDGRRREFAHEWPSDVRKEIELRRRRVRS